MNKIKKSFRKKIGMTLSFFSIFFFIGNSFVHAQDVVNPKVVDLCKKAKHELNQQNFDKAESYLNKAKKIDSTFADIYVIEGDMYNFSLKSDLSVKSYNKAIRLAKDPKPILFFVTAEEEVRAGLYSQALDHYEEYLKRNTDNLLLKETDRGIKTCEFAIEAIANPVKFKDINMGPNINKETDEYLPAITADEEEIIFTVKRPRDKNTECAFCLTEEDFYGSKKENGEWQPRYKLDYPINTGYNEGAQCVSPDGKYLFYTLCNVEETGKGSCDLYWSKRIGNRWSRPRNFEQPVNTISWESQPSIAPDGKTIYFVSNRPGGFGKKDIWKTEMIEEGVFTVPVNLGPTINTDEDEAAPFIHPDGRTLYFASNGHIGMGGYDCYYSTLADTGWMQPVNLGYPINTSADEINLLINAMGTTAYYSSDKDGGYGGVDIYYFDLDERLRPTPVTYIKGKIYDEKTHQPLTASIELIDLSNNQVITSTSSDPVSGEFLACIKTGINVMMNVSHPYYPFYSENFQIEKNYTELEPYHKDIVLRRAEVGETFILRNIFFDFDNARLFEESYPELNKLVQYMKENGSVKIEIGGHTDSMGSADYNEALSKTRARNVYDYLISKGIDKNRLSYKGYGESQPIATNETEEGRALNRRTEFKIIGY
jgi:outer membrane protein OmpA-like peptidoglycan-associated protein/tetratricopeptide (TPR) repeat protein